MDLMQSPDSLPRIVSRPVALHATAGFSDSFGGRLIAQDDNRFITSSRHQCFDFSIEIPI
jgi:hypothetical protein